MTRTRENPVERQAGASSVDLLVVGCGQVVERYYLPLLKKLVAQGDVDRVEYFDPVAERAEKMARRSPQAMSCADWSSALAGPSELAIIASPPACHAADAEQLLAHGKHVLCEKPFTFDADSAERLVAAARRADRDCCVAMVRRFSAAAQLLYSMFHNDRLPRPTWFCWYEGGAFNWPVASLAYFDPAHGNELLWDIGSHAIDLLLWWFGNLVQVACYDDAMGGTAATCRLEIAFENGPVGLVHLSRDSAVRQGLRVGSADFELCCPDLFDGNQPWNWTAGGVAYQGFPGEGSLSGLGTELAWGESFEECFELQLTHMLRAVRGIESHSISADQVVAGIRTLEQAAAQRQLFVHPWFDQQEADRARAVRQPNGAAR